MYFKFSQYIFNAFVTFIHPSNQHFGTIRSRSGIRDIPPPRPPHPSPPPPLPPHLLARSTPPPLPPHPHLVPDPYFKSHLVNLESSTRLACRMEHCRTAEHHQQHLQQNQQQHLQQNHQDHLQQNHLDSILKKTSQYDSTSLNSSRSGTYYDIILKFFNFFRCL